jgi:hypothetical protein
MNQDVQNIELEMTGKGLSDRLLWDWRNPLIALPLATIGMLAASAIIMLMSLLSL